MVFYGYRMQNFDEINKRVNPSLIAFVEQGKTSLLQKCCLLLEIFN